jgi:hypothetical protein
MRPDLSLLRILLSLAAMLLALGYPLFHRGDGVLLKRIFAAVLIICAASSCYLYLRLGPQFNNVSPTEIMNPHDFYHYYVGAKYHRELGYFHLYECSVVADSQGRQKLEPNAQIRDLRTYGYRPVRQILQNSGRCAQRFSEPRWEAFNRDIHTLSGLMSSQYWLNVLRDKGYNATPVWTAYASRITNLLPLESTAALYTILGLDYLFFALILVVVGLTFGWRNNLFVILFWGLNFTTVFGFSRGSVSRLDWLACLVLGLCLIRRKKYASAGALAAIASVFRIFPVLFFFGLGAKALWSLFRTRRIPAHYLRFVVAFIVVLALSLGLTALSPDRPVWTDFTEKISGHDKQIAGYRLGLKYALIDPDLPDKTGQWESKQPLRWTLIGAVLLVLFFAARRLEDHETLGLSFVCVVFMTAPTFYYYELLVIPFMLFVPLPRRRGLSLGMAGFFGWCALCYVFGRSWPLGSQLSHRLSWSLIGLGLLTVALVFAYFREDETRGETTAG